MLRLSSRGGSVERIAALTPGEAGPASAGTSTAGRGFEGLADDSAPGNPPRITEEARVFLEEKLSEERTWNAAQLVEAIEERFGIGVTPEAIRQHLLAVGYRWERTRYVPSRRPPDPEEEKEARSDLEEPKRLLCVSNGGG